jgi:hypothetical protein
MPKPPLPPEMFKGKRVEVRWTEKEFQALVNMANNSGMTVSELIRKCVQEWAREKMKKRNPIPDYV